MQLGYKKIKRIDKVIRLVARALRKNMHFNANKIFI